MSPSNFNDQQRHLREIAGRWRAIDEDKFWRAEARRQRRCPFAEARRRHARRVRDGSRRLLTQEDSELIRLTLILS